MAIPLSYNFRNLFVRKTTTIMTALGIALSVAVLVGISALIGGLNGALAVTGDPLHVIVMRQGSTAELNSTVTREQFQNLKFIEGITEENGEPMASLEVITVFNLPFRSNPDEVANVNVRGLPPMGIRLRETAGTLQISRGRWFDPGKREVAVGRGIFETNEGTSIGDMLNFGRGEWEVVGVFDAGKSAYNSEIWADANLLAVDLGRGGTLSTALLRAEDEATAAALKNRVTDDQRLLLEALSEREYYEKQTMSGQPVQVLGVFVSIIMAIGSSFAAMNTMYAAVARRAREVGVLRMLGFSRGSVLLSFLFESLLLSLLGGMLGCLLILPLDGLGGRIGNFITFSITTFEFEITSGALLLGMSFAAVMGVLGGVLPARAAARQEILGSMRNV